MRSFLFRSLPLLMLAACLCACVPKQGMKLAESSPQQAWDTFIAKTAANNTVHSAFRLSASLRYVTPQGKSARVSALLWGNSGLNLTRGPDLIRYDPLPEKESRKDPYAIRLDLSAGLGSLVASIREDRVTFSAYNPEEDILYTHSMGRRTLLAFGVPIPLTINDLTLLLTGKGGILLGPQAGVASLESTGASTRGFFFPVRDAILPGILELGPDGTLLSWRELNGDGWLIEFTPDEDALPRPRKLRITHPSGHEAVILVKEVSHPALPFSPEQIKLPVPPGALRKSLEPASMEHREGR